MCTIQKPKKRFDYDAYIQGRLIGKYVVIYHDEIPDEPEIKTSEAEELRAIAQPLIAIKSDDDISELFEVNVIQVAFDQSYFSIKPNYTGVLNHKDLDVHGSHWIFGVKPDFPNGRAGPY